MRRDKPFYFTPIQQEARARWDQLEADEELAGPWRQLFRQVTNSPRHVLSELLQNADDAGATWARAYLDGNVFTFQHNGEDFSKSNFQSLCRFGFSDKRHLHTIGFRGMGFKSTFSLGPRVEVLTPSLAVAFREERFTEPIWLEDAPPRESTVIRVAIDGQDRAEWVQQNLAQWSDSPAPLLFFRNIQSLEVQGTTVEKRVEDAGPVGRSQWVRLTSGSGNSRRLLYVTSKQVEFPPDAIEEIRQERNDPNFEIPPCRVELILGLEETQQLFVVLPTHVELLLPFSCNAPFVQDPSRTGIKDPVNSPTNRWLLQRVGELAARTLHEWLANEHLSERERANAYQLVPDKLDTNHTLSTEVTRRIVEAFKDNVDPSSVLLTQDGALTGKDNCLDLPSDFLDVWPAKTLIDVFGGENEKLVSAEVSVSARKRLRNWGWLESVSQSKVLRRLAREPYPPHPADIGSLSALWAIIQTYGANRSVHAYPRHRQIALFPVEGKEELYPAREVARLGAGAKDLSQEDRVFLGTYAPVIASSWLEHLDSIEKALQSDTPSSRLDRSSEAVLRLFRRIDLRDNTGLAPVIQKAAQAIFSSEEPGEEGICLAFIVARADIRTPDEFKFLCEDENWHAVSDGLLYDTNALLEEILPIEWLIRHLLHSKYDVLASPRDRNAWRRWVESSKSRLHCFPRPIYHEKKVVRKEKFDALCKARGGRELSSSSLELKSRKFLLEDYDFSPALWKFWEKRAEAEEGFWCEITRGIALDWNSDWEQWSQAEIKQLGHSIKHALPHGRLEAAWLNRLKGYPCLPDTYGKPRRPALVFRRTPATEPLLDIETFIHPEYDRPEATKFFDFLGVQTKPVDVGKLIDRIRALGASSNPPISELYNLYQALNRTLANLPGSQVKQVQQRFNTEALIYADDSQWHRSFDVFQRNNDDLPDIPVIFEPANTLRLWDELEVPDQPTIEHGIEWLQRLPSGQRLSKQDQRRAHVFLRRVPRKVWDECQHWIDAAAYWTPIEDLRWSASSSDSYQRLFPWVQRATADLSMVSAQDVTQAPFTALNDLGGSLQFRLHDVSLVEPPRQSDWIEALATCLLRVELSDGENERNSADGQNVHQEAQRLARTKYQSANTIRVEPYLDGQPAGSMQTPKALWRKDRLYVCGNSSTQYDALVKAIGTPFRQYPRLFRAIERCLDRSPVWIRQYFSEQFQLREDIPKVNGGPHKDPPSSEDTVVPGDSYEPDGTPEHGEEDGGPEGGTGANGPEDKHRKKRRMSKGKFERFWREHRGYLWDERHDHHVHPDTRHILKAGNRPFDWEEYSSSGELIARYWVGRSSLEKGVEIPADVWGLIEQNPEQFSILLENAGRIEMYSGGQVVELVNRGIITLYPAVYRLRRFDDR